MIIISDDISPMTEIIQLRCIDHKQYG